MNLDEFRRSLESNATIENERLKQDLEDLEKKYDEMCKAYTEKVQSLSEDCRVLANRCLALTKGTMCIFCELRGYRCPYGLSFDDKIKYAKEFKKDAENRKY